MERMHRRIKLACYAVNLSMSAVANLSPLLFITFRSLYGISYTLLGLLVLVNFVTQLVTDLIFSFFSHKFNIPLVVKLTPVLTVLGLLLYAAAPLLFPQNIYVGLLLGTVVFSASAGLAEVLISPVIAALPSENPEREMSKLHSVYAWGVVLVIVISALYLKLLDNVHWQGLALLFLVFPLGACILYCGTTLPKMETPQRVSGVAEYLKKKALWLSVLAIFFGGAAECTMAQWASGYIEQALHIPKLWGDICGVAMFALMMGVGRTMYARRGSHVLRVLLLGSVGATACYIVAALCPVPVVGLIACAVTGLCVSMLWPGSLIVASDYFPTGGVFIYAMMAAGGDFGASVGPQLVGSLTDAALQSPLLLRLAEQLSLTPEQCGMKLGMLVGACFPCLCAVVILLILRDRKGKQSESLKSLENN